jgi:transcription elongation factor Elf1
MRFVCPGCGSTHVRNARWPSLLRRLTAITGNFSLRCRDCGLRFEQQLNLLDEMRYAHCPRCGRDDLTAWAEKYLNPGPWSEMLVRFGAKRHRCPSCRLNFVSFRWRRK